MQYYITEKTPIIDIRTIKDPEVLDKLARKYPIFHSIIVENKNTSIKTLRFLYESDQVNPGFILSHPNSDSEFLDEAYETLIKKDSYLACSYTRSIISSIARNKNTSVATLEKIATLFLDNNSGLTVWIIRNNLIKNPNTSDYIKEFLIASYYYQNQ